MTLVYQRQPGLQAEKTVVQNRIGCSQYCSGHLAAHSARKRTQVVPPGLKLWYYYYYSDQTKRSSEEDWGLEQLSTAKYLVRS